MSKGTLYGVGVGPGDPKLMTLKAVETIEACPVIASPRTPGGGMVALDIAKGAVRLDGKTILPLDFAMSRDPAVRASSHQAAAAAIRTQLDLGFSVAMLNLGDVSIYSSYRYIADLLGKEGYTVAMVPGVTSFCAAAAALNLSLTDMESPVHILPDASEPSAEAMTAEGASIWMKSGKNLPGLLRRLDAAGLLGKTKMVQNCGMADQKIFHSLDNAEFDNHYFTVVIVKK